MYIRDLECNTLEELSKELMSAPIEPDWHRGKWRCWVLYDDNEWGGVWLYADGTRLTPKESMDQLKRQRSEEV